MFLGEAPDHDRRLAFRRSDLRKGSVHDKQHENPGKTCAMCSQRIPLDSGSFNLKAADYKRRS
jgi:hypothetical protein